MAGLDPRVPAALEAALEALAPHQWVAVETPEGERHLLCRVPGGWVEPGDGVTLASGDVADGRPTRVDLLGDDGLLPPEVEVEEARLALARATVTHDREAADAVARAMDDLDSVGFTGAGALRDQALAWLEGGGDDL